MAQNINFHFKNLKKWGSGVIIEKHLKNGTITQDDADLINKYVSHRKAVKAHISDYRVLTCIVNLVYWRKHIHKPYRAAGADDLIGGLGEFKDAGYKQNTMHTRISILKGFYYWLIAQGISQVPVDVVKEIQVPAVDTHTTEPDELWTPEEIKKLLSFATKPMHKAFIALLYESAPRPQEACSITWRDIVPDQYGMKLYITDTKTSKRRYARLTMAAPYLDEWKTISKPEPGDLVFNQNGRPLTYGAAKMILHRIKEKSGIPKRLWMYGFRKSRITQMIKDGYPEAAIRAMIWNNQGTSMMKTYLALGEEDIDKMALGAAGIKKDENKPANPLASKPCSECHLVNKAEANYCNRCGLPLTKEVADRQKMVIEQTHKLPSYKKFEELNARVELMEKKIGLK